MESADLLIKLGERIVQLREEKGMRQVDLAISTNIDDSSIRKIETGKLNLTTKTLVRIAKSLEVEVKDLFDFEQ